MYIYIYDRERERFKYCHQLREILKEIQNYFHCICSLCVST